MSLTALKSDFMDYVCTTLLSIVVLLYNSYRYRVLCGSNIQNDDVHNNGVAMSLSYSIIALQGNTGKIVVK